MVLKKSLSTYFISFLLSKYYVGFRYFMITIAGGQLGLLISPWINSKGHLFAGVTILIIGTILFILEKKRELYFNETLKLLENAIFKEAISKHEQ